MGKSVTRVEGEMNGIKLGLMHAVPSSLCYSPARDFCLREVGRRKSNRSNNWVTRHTQRLLSGLRPICFPEEGREVFGPLTSRGFGGKSQFGPNRRECWGLKERR